MINREITYERSVSRSYMKIPACLEPSFDEEIILKKEIPGCLQVERCYINGVGQYWYNITGKQALDSYSKMKNIGIAFIEKLLLCICSQMEKLEWNLLGTHCLVLEPELIFITNGSEEIYFTLYPENKGEVHTELTKLMEYLLTRLNHNDAEAVKVAYSIYELTLMEGYSLSDIREAIEKNKAKSGPQKEIEPEIRMIPEASLKQTDTAPAVRYEKLKKLKIPKLKDRNINIQGLWKKAMEILRKELKFKPKEKLPVMVYPEEMSEAEPSQQIRPITGRLTVNPTVCLVSPSGKAKGTLLHEGLGDYPDYELSEEKCKIGNNVNADLYIKKNTVSCFHAEIEYSDGNYYLEDLNSTNGTYLNDEAISYKQKSKLSSGDEIRFGDVRYRFL